jgi:hypothetical protein
MITVAFKSPYDPKIFVKLSVPNSLTLSELREASSLSVRALDSVKDASTFGRYPLCPAGALGLMILTKCSPITDEPAIMGMLGGYSFVRQIQKKLEGRDAVDKELMKDSLEQFKIKYGPQFKLYVLQRLDSIEAPWKNTLLGYISDVL